MFISSADLKELAEMCKFRDIKTITTIKRSIIFVIAFGIAVTFYIIGIQKL